MFELRKTMEAIIPFTNRMSRDLKLYSDVSGSFYVFRDTYSFFGENLKNSVAIHIGCSDWKENLQLLESYSIPTVLCDPAEELKEFEVGLTTHRGKLIDWMKFLKDSDCGKMFVNPKWVTVENVYPANFDGLRTCEGGSLTVNSWETLLEKANQLRGKPTDTVHFAVCKIECLDEERTILASLLSSKYRPSIIYVRWSHDPDADQATCESAGHLQSAGYRLLAVQKTGWFLYNYSGQDIYSCCSWTETNGNHPLVQQMKEQVSEFLKNNETIMNLQMPKTM